MSPDAYPEMARVQSQHWWYVARRSILRSQIARLNLPDGAHILEVGSGTGANLDLLAEFGDVVGLEMTAEAIRLAAERCGASTRRITMRQGRCPEDLDALTQKFDLICLFDVLEHIEEDGESLARLRALLKPDGKLLLTVPAYPWMWGPHDVHFHHKRRYTAQSLTAGCVGAGLSIARVSHFNTLLFPLAVVDRMREKLSGKKSSSTRTPPSFINAIFRFIFALELHLLAHMRLPFGLSLMLLATPSESR